MTNAMLRLDNRGVLRLTGSDSRTFLQGLITNDVNRASADAAVYAAMLTPQGKFMFDMIVVADDDDLLLDVEAERKADLQRRLMMYKLRADVDIIDEAGLAVFAAFSRPDTDGTLYADPRHAGLGWRLIADAGLPASGLSQEDYEQKRLMLGVPDGSRDMKVEKDFWLETDAERLNGVSFTKGCFVGQELTARMKHRTSLKKRLVPIVTDGLMPETGATVTTTEGKSAGEVRSSSGKRAIAYLRLEYIDATLAVNDHAVFPQAE